jgi:Tol biopolymer transport system component
MKIASGTIVGSYELLDLIGTGGMGAVYRARDLRLGRLVAIKFLTGTPGDALDILQRFQQEARATAALNDPHIVSLYDVGSHDGRPYVVSELLEGETLRSALAAGPLPMRKALSYARQIAAGLAAAHRRGIIHRDLKPENLFITRDGVVKLLDFGLAKLVEMARTLAISGETTAPGIVLGTVGYMSPEQARGESTDARTDIFSFGAVFYEMLSGRRAFEGESPADTLSAILKEHPPELGQLVQGISESVERIVERCLEKNKDDRFQSAQDLAFALDTITAASGTTGPAPPPPRQRIWRPLEGVLLLAAVAAFVYAIGVRRSPASDPSYRQLTFRRGMVQAARFAPDGQTIVYAAAWEGGEPELFSTRPEAPEARPLQLPQTGLFSISSRGDMALALQPHGFGRVEGTLARAALAGGLPRQLAPGVIAADWTPDGSALAIVRSKGGRDIVEFPVGTQLYDPTPAHVTDLRFSPAGDAIAFTSHPVAGDTAGDVKLVDLKGQVRTLSSGWNSVLGLCWSADGREVWFTAARSGSTQALYAVNRSGQQRLLMQVPATLTLHDVARDGRVLLSRDAWGAGVMALTPFAAQERDLSWLDGSMAWDISDDGRTIVLEESWEGGGAARSIYLRNTDGSPAVRLGDGVPLALSPDKQWVLASTVAGDQLILLPTGVGQQRVLPKGSVASYFPAARWLPNGREFLFSATATDRQRYVFQQSIEGGEPRPVTPAGAYGRVVIFSDGRGLLTRGGDRRITTYSLDESGGRPVPGAEPADVPIAVSDTGDAVYVQAGSSMPAEVVRIDLRTGRRELVRRLSPADPTGVSGILRVVMTPDGRYYAYTYTRTVSALYLATGIR